MGQNTDQAQWNA